jgi:hypothetical protein
MSPWLLDETQITWQIANASGVPATTNSSTSATTRRRIIVSIRRQRDGDLDGRCCTSAGLPSQLPASINMAARS